MSKNDVGRLLGLVCMSSEEKFGDARLRDALGDEKFKNVDVRGTRFMWSV